MKWQKLEHFAFSQGWLGEFNRYLYELWFTLRLGLWAVGRIRVKLGPLLGEALGFWLRVRVKRQRLWCIFLFGYCWRYGFEEYKGIVMVGFLAAPMVITSRCG